MTTGRTVWLSLLLAGTVVMAQEPTPVREVQELVRLRAKCDAQIAEKTKPVLEQYATDLQRLEDELGKSKKFEDAAAVKKERESVQAQLKEGAGSRIGFMSQPQHYADEHSGCTGGESKDNVYAIDVQRVGRRTIARLFIHGSNGTDTSGDVILRKPDGTEATICCYDGKMMAKKPIQSTTYKDVKPTEVDVSQVVDRPGIYQVRFQYTSGRFGLQIRKVELETKNR